MFLKTVAFCACVAFASAALSIGPLEPKPEKFKDVEGCYISDLDAVIPFGTSATSKKGCWEHRCSQGLVEVASCGVAQFMIEDNQNCFVFEDMKKPYPGCCPAIKCYDKSDSANKV